MNKFKEFDHYEDDKIHRDIGSKFNICILCIGTEHSNIVWLLVQSLK